ncbi:MAG: hypothetical protein Q9167_002313 [Letrouitia subvulpina]
MDPGNINSLHQITSKRSSKDEHKKENRKKLSQRHPLQGLCAEHISPLILTYYPPVRGVILSYSNVRFSAGPLHIADADDDEPIYALAIDEYAATFVWVSVDLLLFRPQKGNTIEGWISLQNEGNIGLVCWNFFNANIERKRLPKDWKWISGGIKSQSSKEKLKGSRKSSQPHSLANGTVPHSDRVPDIDGYFEDGDGKRIEGLVEFRVKDIETSRSSDRENGFLSIEGTMLDEDTERSLLSQEITQQQSRFAQRIRRHKTVSPVMPGVSVNGDDKGRAVK